MLVRTRSSLFAFALLLPIRISAAGVRIVDPGGHGDSTSIGAAVASAADGDLLLVRSGTYAAVTLDDRDLAIVADAGANVIVQGTVVVQNLSAGKSFVLSGIEIRGPVTVQGSGPALSITNALGAVRISECVLRGGAGSLASAFNWKPGANALELSTCFDVAIARCTLLGGKGAGSLPDQGFFDFGAAGGDAVRARFTAAAIYDCLLQAGDGGGGEGAGGNGGRGYDHDQGGGGAQFSGCTIRGGNGGLGHGAGSNGGTGGHALFTSGAAHHHLLGDVVAAGTGGQGLNHNGQNGQLFAGTGTYDSFTGSARRLASASLAPSGGTIDVEFTGEAGDRLFVAQAGVTRFHFVALSRGVWLLPIPVPFLFDPVTTLATSGTVVVSLPVGALPPGAQTDRAFLQGLVFDAAGARVLTTPLFVQRLACATLVPDCDNDGTFDSCEILADQSLDTSHEGVLDACEPDCNANGISDGVEIWQGLVADVNHDGVPDACELPQVLHVDASAALYGDGSAAAPFRSLREGFSAAVSGDTIVLADGTYFGPENRDLDLAGRNLEIRSASGSAASCVIDLGGLGRAFALHSAESASFRGLTIRNGRPTGDSYGFEGGGAVFGFGAGAITVRDCVFEYCLATQGGGAIYSQAASLAVIDCTFTHNGQATTYSPGGAVRSESGTLLVLRSRFTQSKGSVGGALLANSTSPMVIEACDFRGNSAMVYGGAIFCSGSAVVDGCLVAGNGAPAGGGIGASEDVLLSHCTIVSNIGSQRGGGLYLLIANGPGNAPIRLHDSIVWGNAAPQGAAIATNTSFDDTLQVRSSDVEGGQAGVSLQAGVLDWDASNFAIDPKFVLPAGPDGNPATLDDNDWRLGLASRCIDSGNNTLVPADLADLDGDGNTLEPVPLDLDLAPRFADVPSVPDTGIGTAPLTDRGAYERQP
jgi:predicted outer membrane repeat protein